jgi:hypothetical protein
LDEKRQCRASSDHHNPLDNRLKDGAALHGILFLFPLEPKDFRATCALSFLAPVNTMSLQATMSIMPLCRIRSCKGGVLAQKWFLATYNIGNINMTNTDSKFHELDTESLLMVSIFRKACPLNRQPTAAMFLHHFRFEIDRTCRVLKLLELVEEAPSTLGFKPTHRLIDIITDGMVQLTVEGKNAVPKLVYDFVAPLWQLVAGDYYEDEEDEEGYEDGQAFCCHVFVVLGLLKEKADGYVPTRLMHKLILGNWVQKLSKTA